MAVDEMLVISKLCNPLKGSNNLQKMPFSNIYKLSKSKQEGKDHESIQSSTTLDPGHHKGK